MDEPQTDKNARAIQPLERLVRLIDVGESQFYNYEAANAFREAAQSLLECQSYGGAAQAMYKACACLNEAVDKESPYPPDAPQAFAEAAIEVFRTIHGTGFLVQNAGEEGPDSIVAEDMTSAFFAVDGLPGVSMETRLAMGGLWTQCANDLSAANKGHAVEDIADRPYNKDAASPLVMATRSWLARLQEAEDLNLI